MEIIFDEDDLEPLIRDMPIEQAKTTRKSKRPKDDEQMGNTLPEMPSLFEASDLAGTSVEATSASNWQNAEIEAGSFVKSVGCRSKAPSSCSAQSKAPVSQPEESDPFSELLENAEREKRHRCGKKDCAKPGSEAPRFISSAADVLSLLGSGDASERAYARATTETSLRAALPDGFSKLENNNKNSAPSEDQTPETLSAKTKRSTKSRKPQQTLLQRAIASLSRREYSRLELKRKLARTLSEGETKESIEAVLDTLEKRGFLSDERYAGIKARSVASRMGDAKIQRELRMRGIDAQTARDAVEGIRESEEIRAYKIWRRRYDELPKTWKEREKQIRYLAYRGFSMYSIMKVLRGEVELPEDGETFYFS